MENGKSQVIRLITSNYGLIINIYYENIYSLRKSNKKNVAAET